MKQPPLPTRKEIDAFLAPCLALLACLFAAMLGAPRASMRSRIEYAERAVQHLVFLWAFARVPPPEIAPLRRAYIRFNTPPGFRQNRASRRLFFRHARIANRGAGVAARIGRLVSVLAKPERYIARFVALILRGRRAGAPIAAAPPAHAFASARALQPQAANSS